MSKFKILSDKYDYFIITIIMTGLLVAVLFQILYRFIPNFKFSWSLELITYLFSWLTWMGIGIGIQNNSHVGIDFILHKVSLKTRFILLISHNIAFIIFLSAMCVLGTKALYGYMQKEINTPAMEIPYYIYRLPIVVGSISGLYRLFLKIISLHGQYKREI